VQRFVVLTLALSVLSCGGKNDAPNPLTPTGTFGGLGDDRGRIVARINGTPITFGVPTGGTFQSAPGDPAVNTLTITGTTADLSRTLTISVGNTLIRTIEFGINPTTGAMSIDPANGQPVDILATMVLRGNALAGAWNAGLIGGNGTFRIATLSATSATGTFSMTMAAQAGSGAATALTVTDGQYNVTF
jgi:hypothetical protein